MGFSRTRPLTRGALKTRRCSILDSWIVPTFCSGFAQCRALKTEVFKIEPKFFVQFFHTMLFSFFTQCYYPHTLRGSVSPVCGIFFFLSVEGSKLSGLEVFCVCITTIFLKLHLVGPSVLPPVCDQPYTRQPSFPGQRNGWGWGEAQCGILILFLTDQDTLRDKQ